MKVVHLGQDLFVLGVRPEELAALAELIRQHPDADFELRPRLPPAPPFHDLATAHWLCGLCGQPAWMVPGRLEGRCAAHWPRS